MAVLRCPSCDKATECTSELRRSIYLVSPRFLFGNDPSAALDRFRCRNCGWRGSPEVDDPDIQSDRLCVECNKPVQLERAELTLGRMTCAGCALRDELTTEAAIWRLRDTKCARCGGKVIVEQVTREFDFGIGSPRESVVSVNPRCENWGTSCSWMHVFHVDKRDGEFVDRGGTSG